MSIVTEILDKIAKACFAAVDVLHHTAKQSRETGAFAPRGSGALGAAARSIRTIELAGEGGSRLLKVRPLKLSNRGRGPDDHFEIQVWKRQVERARRRGEFRMADVAGLKRLTAAALHQAKATWDADLNEKVVDALKVATENGTRLRDTTEAAGQGCQRAMDNAVGACRAYARRETGRSEEDTAGPRNKRRPAPPEGSGRRGKANRRGVRTCARCSRGVPTQSRRRWLRAGILTWPGSGPTFHTADGSAQLQKAQAQCAAWGGPSGGTHARASVWLRRFSLGRNLR